mmetsp:Transcript_118323/g.166319  ORF Transcript_118323/g.166319 Transcript_118323/m.166319 type:complete len:85 (-) Transcript_118323:94-348(-)
MKVSAPSYAATAPRVPAKELETLVMMVEEILGYKLTTLDLFLEVFAKNGNDEKKTFLRMKTNKNYYRRMFGMIPPLPNSKFAMM